MKTPFAEIDLIYQVERKLFLVVEVKSLGQFDFIQHRVSSRQKQRLLRARSYLESQWKSEIMLWWAYVYQNEVYIIET